MNFFETKQFTKDRKNLPKKIQLKIIERLTLLLENPNNPILNLHRLNPPYQNKQSINISGNLRLIFELEDGVYILYRVGTHSELYG
jgi:mRNA-degrading endonuclease YafQ of YafQ-DinJ toxin-antitoxin module